VLRGVVLRCVGVRLGARVLPALVPGTHVAAVRDVD
jgi:hypothetical protein